MKVITRIPELKRLLRKERKIHSSIGFVPTMGALHDGHLSLIRKSTTENDYTVCSIFVNPVQFNNPADLEKYPRSQREDISLLESAGCDLVLLPEVKEMYPGGTIVSPDVDFGLLDKVLEGKFRPGHFKGVAVAVKRLFDLVEPRKAYFGKKDYQQLLVIRKLVRDLDLPVEIVACPTVREPDGLAMSSRNMRLTIHERKVAPLIYQVLLKVREKAGTLPVRDLANWAIKKISENPEFSVEYFEIVDSETLLTLTNWKPKEKALACTAVYLGDVRLIDNMELFS
jgi:pantoate--beta-alanine ligase